MLLKRVLIFIVALICVMPDAMADCHSVKHNLTLKNNYGLSRKLTESECWDYSGTRVQFPGAISYRLVCKSNDQFRCIPYECPNGSKLNKNGFCAGVPTDQTRYHEDVMSYIDYSKLTVFDACDSFKPSDQSGVVKEMFLDKYAVQHKYSCITDFADYSVSTPMAIELIKFKNWPNGIGMISPTKCTIQQDHRYKPGRGRSVRCESENGIFVEFIFGSIDGSLKTSVEDIAAKLCPKFGFVRYEVNAGTQSYCYLGDNDRQREKALRNANVELIKRGEEPKDFQSMYEKFKIFLHESELMDIEKADRGNAYKILPLRKDKDYNKYDSLTPILDTNVFSSVVAYGTYSVRNLIQTYIERQLTAAGYKIQDIVFYSARSDHFYTTDHSSWPVRISACNPRGECYVYTKIFRFRSLFGGGKLAVKSLTDLSAELMSCAILDGMFDSKHCFFLEEDINKEKKLCEKDTNELIRSVSGASEKAKAYFDNENKMCVLNQSNKNAKTLKTLSVAAQIGALVIATVATWGAGSVFSFVVGGVGLLADGIALGSEIKMNKASVKFLKKSTRCFDAKCAKKYFEEEFKHMLRLMDQINDNEYRVIDNEMDRLVGLLDDKIIGEYATKLDEMKKETSGFFNNMSTEEAVATVATIVSVAMDATNASKLIKKLFKVKPVKPKFVTRINNRINKLTNTTTSKGADNVVPKSKSVTPKTMPKNTSKLAKFEITKIDKVKDNGDVSVFKFTDSKTGKVYYLKHTDNFDEITRTKKAHEILGDNSGIVHTVQITEDDQKALDILANTYDIQDSAGNFWFLMEEMPGSQTGFLLSNDPTALNTVLGGKPITIQEQDEILQSIHKLNDNGIVHGDLGSNMFYMREPNGKLRVDIIDYEPWSAEKAAKNIDIEAFNADMEELVKSGLAESKTIPTAGIRSNTTNIAKTMVVGTDNTVLRAENGISFGRWKFDVITDNANNIKYYERAVDGDFQTLAHHLSDDFGKQAIVFERDNEYFIALFDNSDDLDIFVKHEPDIIIKGKYSASNNNTQMSLNDIENMYQQKLHDDVLALQQTENMDAKVAVYNKLIQRAKKELSTAEYNAFDQMLDLEIANKDLNLRIKTVEQNLRSNNFSEKYINMYLNDYKVQISHNQEILGKLQQENKNAAKLLYDNYSTLVDPHYIIRNSNDLVTQKQMGMTYEISKRVDKQALFDNVKQFKNDIVVNFPEDMYRKAKTWDAMPGTERANFIVNDLIPYLQKIQGLEHEKLPVYLQPSSQIGGNAAFCDKFKCFQVSFEAIETPNFDNIVRSLAHESVHAGQYIKGGRSALSKEIVELSDVNYVAALTNLMANKTNAVETEAYMTDYLFDNILDEIAAYHNW